MTIWTSFFTRAAALVGAFSIALAPAASQPTSPAGNQTDVERNFDPNLLLYAGLPALIAIILAIAASSGGDSQPASP